jgi:hypothetical protein
MKRFIIKATFSGAAIAALLLTGASTARAQTPEEETGWLGETPTFPPPRVFININAASQLDKRSLTTSAGTFASFNETGTLATAQNVGRGIVFDATAGFHVNRHFAIAGGFWTSAAKSAASGGASIPDPLVYGQYAIKSVTDSTLRQHTIGIDLQAVFKVSIVERLDVSLFAGPTFVQTKQDVGSTFVAPDSATPTMTVARQTARSAKAGNVGFDVTWMTTDRYGIGFVVRYVGAEVPIPADSKLQVGGLQVGAGMRYRF